MARIYLDQETATWGDAENVRIVEVTEAQVEYLSEASDSMIRTFNEAKDGLDEGELPLGPEKLKVRWSVTVEEVYEAEVTLDRAEVELYEYDRDSFLLIEVLPGIETAENQVSNVNVSERDIISVVEVDS